MVETTYQRLDRGYSLEGTQADQQVRDFCCTRYSEYLLAGRVTQYSNNNNAAPAASLPQIVHNSKGTVLKISQSHSLRNKGHAKITSLV
jgi:hypothetical protein